MLRFKGRKLSRTILTSLAISLALPLGVFIVISAAHQSADLIDEMTLFGDELFHVVYGGIEYPMSVGDDQAVREQLLQMHSKMRDVQIHIADLNQRIVYTTEAGMFGGKIDDSIYNQAVWKELLAQSSTGRDLKRSFEEKIDGRRYLSMVRLIENRQKCHRCHGSEQKILGSMVVRMGTDRTYANIYRHVSHYFIAGLLGIAMIVSISYMLLSWLVTRPVTRLAGELQELPEKIEEGACEAPKNTIREDEIGFLETAFYKMRRELIEKNRIIRSTNQELSAANRELAAFAYSVSHDLRAPLRNIDGFSRIVLDEYGDRLEGRGEHYLKRIRGGVINMSKLIDDMLDFSRAGRIELRLQRTGMNRLVSSVLQDFSGIIRERNAVVEVADLPDAVCDQKMMQRVFANLISNAIKYGCESGGTEIKIGYEEESRAFYVADNGIGFDMQYHDRIFNVFQRLQLPEEYEGTGIGLAVAKRLVERHNGGIWAESEKGSGSTFYVQLPPGGSHKISRKRNKGGRLC